MRVIANVDEADIGGVREGQRVSFTVDAYPGEAFNGEVTQVRQEGTVESNVVTYEVVISAPNNELKLKPSLTANVTIFTLEKQDVLYIPTKAMRFTPSPETIAPEDQIIDCNSPKKVWVKEGNSLKAIAIETGISNGTLTEVTNGIAEGTEIIVDASLLNDAFPMNQERSPFTPGPRKKDKK
jgi:HlyD family secretion protein